MGKEQLSRCPIPHHLLSEIRSKLLGRIFPEKFKKLEPYQSEIFEAIRGFERYLVKNPEIVAHAVDQELNSLFPENEKKTPNQNFAASHVFREDYFDLNGLKQHELNAKVDVFTAINIFGVLNGYRFWVRLLEPYFTQLNQTQNEMFVKAFNEHISGRTVTNKLFADMIEAGNHYFFEASLMLYCLALLFGKEMNTLWIKNFVTGGPERLRAFLAAKTVSETYLEPVASGEEFYERVVDLFSPQGTKRIPMTKAYKLLLEKRKTFDRETSLQQRDVDAGKGYRINSCPAQLLTAEIFAFFGKWLELPQNKEKIIALLTI